MGILEGNSDSAEAIAQKLVLKSAASIFFL